MALVEMVCGFVSPVRLLFGPMLVHRQYSLSASAPQCVETEPPGHRHGCAVIRPVPLQMEIPLPGCPKRAILHLLGLTPG